MRWPIRRQLLVPLLLVVVVSSVLSSGISAWVGSRWARHEEQNRLARVVTTLTDAGFPLSNTVLKQMTGLSGADFVVWDQRQHIQAATLSLSPAVIAQLQSVPEARHLDDLSHNPRIEISGRRFLVARVPLRRAAMSTRSLLVLYPEDRWWTATREAVLPPLLAGGVTALVAIGLTTWWSQRFVTPIARLSHQAEEIAGGIFQPMPLPKRDDELRDLTTSINRMVQQLASYEQQVRRHERLRTLGQLGAGLAHQLRNWLGGARLALQFHARECPLGEHAESTDMALRQIGLMESYLQRFLTLGAGRSEANKPPAHQDVDLPCLIEDVLSLIRPRGQHVGVEIRWSPPARPVNVRGDRDELQELLVNLLLNAIDAASQSEAPPWVRVELDNGRPDRLRLKVSDSGSGPAEKIAEQLFEPFVTDKPEGTGLGLAVARQIAQEHGGTLSWHRENNATVFELELPLDSAKITPRVAP